jgi:hypothetical protein
MTILVAGLIGPILMAPIFLSAGEQSALLLQKGGRKRLESLFEKHGMNKGMNCMFVV